MKILLLLFLLICGCKENNLLDELENGFYQLDEIFVEISKDEMHQEFQINENDYEDFIALKTLVVYEQKEIYVFYNASFQFLEKLKEVNKEGYELIEKDSYLYYGSNDEKVIELINRILNR